MTRWSKGQLASVALWIGFLMPTAIMAEDVTELEQLQRKVDQQDVMIQRQQLTIQQLLEKVEALEVAVGGTPPPPPIVKARVSLEAEELPALPQGLVQRGGALSRLEVGGYVDVGYVDAAGSGSVSTSALHVNSRGDTLTSLGLDGDSSLLVNEVNLDLRAHLSSALGVVTSVDLLPRSLSYTATGGTAATDSVEVDLAYLTYQPFTEPNRLTETVFGDLQLSVGKFESPFGIEYRSNESPDRVNITRSMMSIYWTGYPVGLKAKGAALKDLLSPVRNSALTYTLALANAEPWLSTLADVDRATNSKRTVMGRFAYGFDVSEQADSEWGLSFAYGPRTNQGDNNAMAESLGLDGRLTVGPFTVRTEYDYSDLDRPRTGGNAATFSHYYVEIWYELARPGWWPGVIPLVSLTPYCRYDTRDFNSTPAVGTATVQEIKRHTLALRYVPRLGTTLKGEYQLVGEAEGASVNDNTFLMSLVQQF